MFTSLVDESSSGSLGLSGEVSSLGSLNIGIDGGDGSVGVDVQVSGGSDGDLAGEGVIGGVGVVGGGDNSAVGGDTGGIGSHGGVGGAEETGVQVAGSGHGDGQASGEDLKAVGLWSEFEFF